MAILKYKRSAVPSKVPSIAELNLGELAINTYDGKLYVKKDNGTQSIVQVGAGAGSGVQTITSTDGSVAISGTATDVNLSVSVAAATNTILLPVRNNTGSLLAKGTVVYINGALGQNPTVTKAIATSDATSAQTLGLITADINNNSVGNVTLIGSLNNLDTSAYTDGQQLYLSPATAGALTATKPIAPYHMVYVAVVEHAHPTQGKLFVKVQNGYEMDELHDVSAVSPANNDGLFYNTATSLWEKKSIPTALGSQTQKTFFAAPNAANGLPTFRAILASDIPTLNQDTTGNAANITGTYGGTLTSSQVTTALGFTPVNYTLPKATATTLGGVKLFDATVQTVAANAVTSTASRTYGVQLNSADQMVVNVPWVDTNSGGTVTSVSGTANQISVTSGSTAPVVSLTNTAVTAGIYANTNLTVDAQGRITAASNGRSLINDDASITRVTYPIGAQLSVGTASVTGAIKITLPTSWTDTMMSMRVRIYNYNGGQSFEVNCGGYNYNPTTSWINTFAYIVGQANVDRNFTVRFGHDGTNCCIVIGEIDSVWSYPKIVVEDFMAGHSNFAKANWDDGWSISTITTLPTITSTISKIQVGRFGNAWYDSDNTAYVVDPSGTSNIVGLTVANTITGSISGNAGGSAATVTSITGNTGLLRNSLVNAASLDGLTNTNFRTTMFGSATAGYQIATSRWGTVIPTPFTGLAAYGTAINWAGSDTHGFLAVNYNTAGAIIGGGNADAINWTATLLHSSNYSSYALPLTGGTMSGLLSIQNSNDVQLYLNGNGTSWAGISFADVSGNDYIWYNGSNSTFSVGGGGSSVANKKLHVHGGMSIGNGIAASAVATNSLVVESEISATIFRDRDDGAWYVDPAGRSRMSTIDYGNSGYYLAGGDWGWRNNTPYGWIQFGPANTSHAHIYTDRTNFYFNAQIQVLGGSQVNELDMRSAMFRDTGDTNRYADPAGTSVFNGLTVVNRISGGIDGDAETLYSYTGTNGGGLQYWNLDANATLNPSTSWHYGIRMAHGDADTYYNATLAVSFFGDDFYLRRKAGGVDQTWRRFWHNGDVTISAATDFRAPMFRDLDNTDRYVDPAATSVVNTIEAYGSGFRSLVNGAASFSSQLYFANAANNRAWNWQLDENNNAALWGYNGVAWLKRMGLTNDSELFLRNSSGSDVSLAYPSTFGYSSSYKTMVLGNQYLTTVCIGVSPAANASGSFNGGGLGLEVMFRNGVNFITPNAANDGYHFPLSLADGFVTSSGSFRAPIFRDLDNTAYYVDPQGGSILGGSVSFSGGSYVATNGDIYARRDNATTGVYYFATGGDKYLYWDGGQYIFGSGGPVTGTRFTASTDIRAPAFYDSVEPTYYLDPNASTALFSNGLVVAGTEGFQSRYYSNNARNRIWSFNNADAYGISYFQGGAGISGDTIGFHFGTASAGASSFKIVGNNYVLSTVDVHAPFFRDSDSTGYFLNPADSGNALRTAGYWQADTTAWAGDINGKIQFHDNSWYFSASNSWVLRASNATSALLVTQAGIAIAGTDFRAPIFRDSDNTAYYTDPLSNSVLNTLTLGGRGTDQAVYYSGFTLDANTMTGNSTGFTYSVNAPFTGPIVSLGNASYTMQLNAPYGGGGRFAFRTRNGDTAAFNSWQYPALYDQNINGGGELFASAFKDSNNTAYYVDPANLSVSYRMGAQYFQNNADVSDDNSFGLYFASGLSAAYAIYREAGAWTHPYPDLRIAFHTGIKMGANAGYGGMKFYTDYDMLSQVMSINNSADGLGAANVYVNNSIVAGAEVRGPIFRDTNDAGYYADPASNSNLYSLTLSGGTYFQPNSWIQFNGDYGLYWPNNYAAHLHPNSLSSYTQLAIRGGKGGYGGFFDQTSAVNGIMYDGSGNGGVYREANGRWYFYHNVANVCTGFNTSSTYAGWDIYAPTGVRSSGRMDATIFYDENDNAFYANPASGSNFQSLRLRQSGISLSSGNSRQLEINNAGTGACNISFHREGAYGAHFGLDTDNVFKTFGWSASAGYTAMHVGDFKSWGIATATTEFSAPLFRVSGNSAYYLDAASTGTSLSVAGSIVAAANIIAYSDIRIKANVETIPNALDKLDQIRGVTYTRTDLDDKEQRYAGVIAHEVEAILPEAVRDTGNIKAVDYNATIALLIQAVKELRDEVEHLKNRS